MELVGAGLDDHVDDAALEVAEFGRGVVGDHLELGDGVQVRLVGRQVVRSLVVVHAVQQEVVALFAIAVDIRTAAARGALPVVEAGRIRRGDARRQQRQRDRVAADERRVDDGFRADHRADLRGLGLQQRGFARDGHGLG